MGGLEHRVAGVVVDVAAGRDADAADLGGQCVGEVVAVQVGGGDHVELGGAGEHLLERDVGDGVLAQDAPGGQGLVLLLVRGVLPLVRHRALPLAPGVGLGAELPLRHLVPPVAERAFGELHNVALVHEGHALAAVVDRVADGGPRQAPRAFARDGLDADAGGLGEADLVVGGRECFLEQVEKLAVLVAAGLELDPGVDVFGVLAEDHHVHELRAAHRRGHALEPPHRPQADVEVHDLPHRHVERADAAADGGGQRPLDRDQVLLHEIDGLVGEPGAGQVVGLLAGVDLHPVDLPPPAVGARHRGVDHVDHHRRDVDADAVASDVGDDGIVGDAQLAVFYGDFCAVGGDLDVGGHGSGCRRWDVDCVGIFSHTPEMRTNKSQTPGTDD